MKNPRDLFFSIVVPVYNRPVEMVELLRSLTRQCYTKFEVLIVDDGSQPPIRESVQEFERQLDLRYFYIPNGGQGFARNFGFQQARGDYFVVFDSDCLIPENYLEIVNRALIETGLDAYGGPDAAHASFSTIQKAISYAMTSPLTTGGIRGGKRRIGRFYPRSFNMGLSRTTWEETGGFRWTNQSEDMELSTRMHDLGFKVGLLPEATVYHKRRVDWRQFFNQIYSFGQGRIRLFRQFRSGLKPMHFLPALFTLGSITLVIAAILWVFSHLLWPLSVLAFAVLQVFLVCGISLLLVYSLLIFLHAWQQTRAFSVACSSIPAVFIQFYGYGLGFIKDLIHSALRPNHYKREKNIT